MPTALPQGRQTSQETGSHGPEPSPGAAAVPAGVRRRDREGGRHGRAAFPGSAADAVIRARLVRIAVVPCAVATAVCAAAVVCLLQTGAAALSGRAWPVLLAALVLICAVAVAAGAAATSEARATADRCTALRRRCARDRAELQALVDRVRQGERPAHHAAEPAAAPDGDALDLLAHEMAAAGDAASAAVAEAVELTRSTAAGEQKVEVFVNLARRLQSLVHREIELLDDLENQVEDPDLLKGLFHVDHLATRTRRHAENLAVLGGALSRRQWSRPVAMTEVLRSAIAEVEQYPRIKLVPQIEGTLRGHAVADVIHLLAELVENASVYSDPQTHVLLRAQLVTAGLAVEVEDRGLGMTPEERTRMNGLLADPDHVDMDELLADGRIGLFVVSSLARRHGIAVRLESNIYGGVQAVLVLPRDLLGPECQDAGALDGAVPGARDGHTPGPSTGELPAVTGPDRLPGPDRVRGPDRAPGPDRGYGATAPEGPYAPPGTASGPAAEFPAIPAARGPLPTPGTAPRTGAPGPAASPEDAPADGSGARPTTGAAPPEHAAGEPSEARAAGPRPSLPRRRRQEHLVPELRGEPILRPTADRAGSQPEHDPGLMAAFRRGISLSDDAFEAGHSAGGDAFRPTLSPAFDGPDTTDPRPTDPEAPTARPRGDEPHHGE
ncbi:ATP-binding protein [Streptomyces sp. BBFR2]|uniref:sensor histidine kinase n=1 Tax=Streptomyces sp. BBFR2 TaxID=3372854 RepID=UPI0037D9A0DF